MWLDTQVNVIICVVRHTGNGLSVWLDTQVKVIICVVRHTGKCYNLCG